MCAFGRADIETGGDTMPVQALFGLSVLTSFVAFGIVAKLYIVPRLKTMSREGALRCLIAPHMFRFVGLSFLVPGVVSPALSTSFAAPAGPRALRSYLGRRVRQGVRGSLFCQPPPRGQGGRSHRACRCGSGSALQGIL